MPHTQVQHPWRTTIRTAFQVGVGFASVVPYIVAETHVPVTGLATQVVAVSAAVTRIMALPAVADFLDQFAPWLAPAKRPKDEGGAP